MSLLCFEDLARSVDLRIRRSLHPKVEHEIICTELNRIFGDYCQSFRENYDSSLYVSHGIVENYDIKAVSIFKGGKYGVAISEGCVISIYRLMYYAMSHPKVLPWLGDVSREIEHPAPKPPATYFVRADSGISERRPMSTPRYRAASILAQELIVYLFLHELGHIWLGHIDLWEYNRRSQGAVDLEPAFQSLLPIDFHYMELQADRFSAKNLMHTVEYDDKIYKPNNPEWEIVAPGSTRVILRMWAIHMLYAIYNSPPIYEGIKGKYPENSARQANSAMATAEQYCKMHGYSQEVAKLIAKIAVIEANRSLSKFSIEIESRNVEESKFEASDRYFREIKARESYMEGLLTNFRRAKVASDIARQCS